MGSSCCTIKKASFVCYCPSCNARPIRDGTFSTGGSVSLCGYVSLVADKTSYRPIPPPRNMACGWKTSPKEKRFLSLPDLTRKENENLRLGTSYERLFSFKTTRIRY